MNHQINFKNNEVLYANSKKVSCDGGAPSSKHPLIYLHMGDNDFITCPYCSRHFSLNRHNSNHPTNLSIKNKKK